jgi:dihydrofolate reductase
MVLTTRPGLAISEGADITFAATPTAEAIRSFSAATPKRLWVFGGGRVVTDGVRGGAIDTLDITLMPEALGSGIPLFTDAYAGPMKLLESVGYANGAVRLVYQLQSTAVAGGAD